MAFVAIGLRLSSHNVTLPPFRSCTAFSHGRRVVQLHRESSQSLFQIGYRNTTLLKSSYLQCQCSRTAFSHSQSQRGIIWALPPAVLDTVRRLFPGLSPLARRTYSSQFGKKLPFESDVVTKDTLIYSFPNDSYYKLLTYFGIGQFAFWMYLSVFAFTNLRDAPVKEQEELMTGSASSENLSWWRKINLGESKFKNGISLLCFSVGM